MDNRTVLIRADGNRQIGTGHVMRCLALAQAWQVRTAGPWVFATATDAPALEARLGAEGAQTVRLSTQPGSEDDARLTIALAHQCHAAWIVVDGYHFGAEYQRILKEAGFRLLVIDDYGHATQYYADVILNQNLHATERLYTSRTSHTRLLLGNRYLLLRREFVQQGARRRTIPAVAQRALVTLGGSDPENVTARVIQALSHIHDEELQVTVVVGGSNPHAAHLQTLLHASPLPIVLKRDVPDLTQDMRQADIAVAAAGSTAWELAFMGLPSLLIEIADNQRLIATHLAQSGAALNLGWHDACTPSVIATAFGKLRTSTEMRRTMAEHGQALVDGSGAARVVMAMTGDTLRLRNVQEQDCRLLWEWANDPEVRAVSFSSVPISWEEHVRWFQAKMQSRSCLFFIAVDDEDVPVGQVRFDVTNDTAVISISLDRRQRNKRYGSTLLRLSAQTLFATTRLSAIHAYVKADNHASLRAFTHAGYTHYGTTASTEHPAEHLILPRSTYPC